MAVIVLNSADFSANNIGRIELDRSFVETTKRMLGYYGITVDEDDDFQKAFNTFIIDLTVAGVLPKVKGLCLPFMANISQSGSLTYAQKNAINGENFFDSDISGRLSLNSNGLKAVIGGTIAHAKMIGVVSDFTSFHYGGYNITNEEKTYSTNSKYIYGDTGKVTFLNKWNQNSEPDFRVTQSIYGDGNYCSVSCLILATANTSKKSIVCNGQVVSGNSVTFKTNNNTNPSVLQFWGQGDVYQEEASDRPSNSASSASWSLFTVGDYLTDQECVQYNNAVNKLMSAVREYL